jgi:hypothetical protein
MILAVISAVFLIFLFIVLAFVWMAITMQAGLEEERHNACVASVPTDSPPGGICADVDQPGVVIGTPLTSELDCCLKGSKWFTAGEVTVRTTTCSGGDSTIDGDKGECNDDKGTDDTDTVARASTRVTRDQCCNIYGLTRGYKWTHTA